MLVDATVGWFLLQRKWSWDSIVGRTRVRYLQSEHEVRIIVQYLQVARIHATTYGLAELSAAAEKALDQQTRREFYESVLLPLLALPAQPGIREGHIPARALIERASKAGLLFLGLPDIAAWELARRLRAPLLTEDGRLADVCRRTGIDTWDAARLLRLRTAPA